MMLTLIIMTLFLIKHFIADFIMQTPDQVEGKGKYGNFEGISHSLDHAGMTLAVLIVPNIIMCMISAHNIVFVGVALACAAFDFLTHYHIDYFKMKLGNRVGCTPSDKMFWILVGFDQLLHNIVYVVMTYVIVRTITGSI